MIVIINGVDAMLTRRVAERLAARFDSGAVIDSGGVFDEAPPLPGQTAHDLVVPVTVAESEPLARLRRRLFELDDTTYLFRLVHSPQSLAETQQAELAANQEQAADRGDMGYPVTADESAPAPLGARPESPDSAAARDIAPSARLPLAVSLDVSPDTPATCDFVSIRESGTIFRASRRRGFPAGPLAAMIWDNLHEPVELAVYDARWPQRYHCEQGALREALGDLVLDIHHIGSTAVPALVAKGRTTIL